MCGNFPPENNDDNLPWLLFPYFFYAAESRYDKKDYKEADRKDYTEDDSTMTGKMTENMT